MIKQGPSISRKTNLKVSIINVNNNSTPFMRNHIGLGSLNLEMRTFDGLIFPEAKNQLQPSSTI